MSISSAKDFFAPLSTWATPMPMMISPLTTTITRPAGHASTPEVACLWVCVLDELEPSATAAALTPSAA
jgi:hypothetical protein